MQKFWNWLVLSSADPSQAALTAKGMITFAIPVLMYLVPIFHFHVTPDNLNTLPGTIYDLVFWVFTTAASLMTVLGIFRKLWLTFVA